MTTTPDPQTVREIAQEIILKQAKYWNALEIRQDYRTDPRCARLNNEDFTDLRDAVINAITDAQVTVSWPDEQPQDDGGRDDSFAMVAEQPAAEQDGDEAAGRVAAYLDRMEQLHSEDGRLPYVVVAEGIMRNDPTLMAADVRAVLADRNRLAARVAELEAENARMREELDRANHSAKRCPAINDHPLYGPFRCDLPTHGSSDHFGGPPGGWVKWQDAAPQQPARDTADGGAE